MQRLSSCPPNKALQRSRSSFGRFPWRSVRAGELGRWASQKSAKFENVPLARGARR